LAAAGAAAFLAGLIATGVYLWLSGSDRAKTKGEVGRGLLISGVIGIAFAWVQFEINEYQREADEKREAIAERAAARQSLQLTIGLQRDLTGIDLTRRDIAGFYFRGKILREHASPRLAQTGPTSLASTSRRRSSREVDFVRRTSSKREWAALSSRARTSVAPSSS